MRLDHEVHLRLSELHDRLTRAEAESLVATVPDGQSLIVRLDGIKASKHHLKDTLHNAAFSEALAQAIQTTYYIWRNWAPEENRPYLLGALALSDEVSFIVNRGPNFYEQRVLKICTTLGGTLSSAMSLAFDRRTRRGRPKPEHAPVIAFDARPLLVRGPNEVHDYCSWRWLLACRNAMGKVLRLHGACDDLYASDLADNIHKLSIEVDDRGLWGAYQEATRALRLFVADSVHDLEERCIPSHPSERFLSGDDLPWSAWT